MANIILAFPNYADKTTTSVSGGSWNATYGLANLADPSLAKVARSTNVTLASTQADFDLYAARWIKLITLGKHTISRLATIRWRASNVAGDFSSPVYDSGWLNVWPVVYPQYSLSWGGASSLDGRLNAEDVAGYNLHYTLVLSTAHYARYWRMEINDTANTAGFIDISRVFLAGAWQPTINMQVGASLGWSTATTAQQSDGGATYFNVRPRRREMQFTIPMIGTDEATINAFELQRQLGIHGQFWVVTDPDDTVQMFRRSFPATLRQLSPLEQKDPSFHTTPFSATEVL